MKEMGEFTYGNTPAAIRLATLIKEKYPKISKVGKYLGDMNRSMFLLACSHHLFKYDMGMLETIMLQNKDYHLDRIRNCKSIPDEVRSYTLNVATKSARVWLKVVSARKVEYMKEHLKRLNENNIGKSTQHQTV